MEYLEDEEVHEKKLLEQTSKLCRLDKEKQQIERKLKRKLLSSRQKGIFQESLAKQQEKVLKALKGLQLNRWQIDIIGNSG